jgi:hypothetical protein
VIRRLRLAWHVLRGRPLIYRAHFASGIILAPDMSHCRIVENQFHWRGIK